MKNKFEYPVKLRVVASVLLFVFVAQMVPATEIRDSLSRGQVRLDHYLEKASLETSEEKWKSVAQKGFLIAMEAWESSYLLEHEDRAGYDEERIEAETNYNKEIEKRYLKWKTENYLEEKYSVNASELYGFLSNVSGEWTYGKDAEGDGIYIKSGEADEARESWVEYSSRIINEYLVLNNKALVSAQGLVYEGQYISEREQAEIMAEAARIYAASRQMEIEQIALSEGNSLLRRMLYDSQSERKMTDSEAANAIAYALANETTNATEKDIYNVLAAMETEINSLSDQDLSDVEKNWIDTFERTMEQAMAKWDETENQFLLKRAEWEKNATDIYLDDEQQWEAARLKLLEKRKEWNDKVTELINEGLVRWQKEKDRISSETLSVLEEYKANLKNDRETKEKILDIQIETYDQSRNILAMSGDGINGWNALYADKYKDKYSYWKTEADGSASHYVQTSENIKNVLNLLNTIIKQNIDKNVSALDAKIAEVGLKKEEFENQKKAIEAMENQGDKNEIKKQLELLESKISKLEESISQYTSIKDKLKGYSYEELKLDTLLEGKESKDSNGIKKNIDDFISEYESILNNYLKIYDECVTSGLEKNTDNEFTAETVKDFKDLAKWTITSAFYWGNCKNNIKTLYSYTGNISFVEIKSNTVVLDELTLEELKEEAVLKYWQEQKTILESVVAYITNETAGAESYETTKAKLKAAEEELEAKLNNYKTKTESLDQKKKELTDLQDTLNQKKTELNDALVELRNIQNNYYNLVASFHEATPKKLLDQIDKLIIEDSSTNAEEVQKKLKESAANYYETYRKLYDTQLEEKIQKIKDTFTGENNSPIPNNDRLSELKNTIESQKESIFTIQGYSSFISTNIEDLNFICPYHVQALVAALKEWHEAGKRQHSDVIRAYIRELLAAISVELDIEIETRENILLYIEGSELNTKEAETEESQEIRKQDVQTEGIKIALKAAIEDLKTKGQEDSEEMSEYKAILEYLERSEEKEQELSSNNEEKDSDTDEEQETSIEDETIVNEKTELTVKEDDAPAADSNANKIEETVAKLISGEIEFEDGYLKQIVLLHKKTDSRKTAENYNANITSIMEAYGDYRADLVNRRNEETLAKIREMLCSPEKIDSYDRFKEYLDKLEDAGNNLRGAAQEVLECYINEFIKEIAIKKAKEWSSEALDGRYEELVNSYNSMRSNASTDNNEDELKQLDKISWELNLLNMIKSYGSEDTSSYHEIIELLNEGITNENELIKENQVGNRLSMVAVYESFIKNEGDEYSQLFKVSVTSSGDIEELNNDCRKYYSEMNEYDAKRGSIIGEIQQLCKVIKLGIDEYREKKDNISYANKILSDASEKYDAALKAYDTAYSNYINGCSQYNLFLSEIDSAYDEYNVSRNAYRTANEIHEWAENAYVRTEVQEKGNYKTPAERLEEATKKVEAHAASLEVLQAIVSESYNASTDGKKTWKINDSKYNTAIDSYKAAAERYYKAIVAATELTSAIEIQKDIVSQLQASKYWMEGQIVTHISPDEVINIPDDIKRLVEITIVDGKYVIKLADNKIVNENSNSNLNSNEGTNSNNESEKSIEFKDNEREVLEWMKDISKDSEKFYKIVLAAMYHELLSKGVHIEKQAYETQDEEGNISITYKLERQGGKDSDGADIPVELTGNSFIDITYGLFDRIGESTENLFQGYHLLDKYKEYGYEIILEIYNEMMSDESGKEDIAKYLLYKDNYLSNPYYLKGAIEYLQYSALTKETEDITETIKDHRETANSMAILYAITSAAATVAWIMGPVVGAIMTANAAAFLFASTSHTYAANQLEVERDTIMKAQLDAFDDESSAKSMITGLLDSFVSENGYLGLCNELEAEQKKLNQMLYGSDTAPDSGYEMSYADFCSAYDSASKNRENLNNIKATDLIDKTQYEERLNGMKNKPKSFADAMNMVFAFIAEKEAKEKKELQKVTDDMKSTQNANIQAYQKLVEEKASGKTVSNEELKKAAKKAYGAGTFRQSAYITELMTIQETLDPNTSYADFSMGTEGYILNNIEAIRSYYRQALLADENAKMLVKQGELNLLIKDVILQEQQYNATLDRIIRSAETEWNNAFKTLYSARGEWKKNYENNCSKSMKEWQDNYQEFLNDKRDWILRQYMAVTEGKWEQTVAGSDLDLEQILNKTLQKSTLLASVEKGVSELKEGTDNYVQTLFAGTGLDALFHQIENKVESIGKGGSVAKKGSTINKGTLDMFKEVQEASRSLGNEYQKLAADLTEQQASIQLEQSIEAFLKSIEARNQAVKDEEKSLALDGGYKYTGSSITRKGIVGSTISGAIYRNQSIHVYQDFVLPEEAPVVELSRKADSKDAISEIFTAMKKLKDWSTRVFGETDTDGNIIEYRVQKSSLKEFDVAAAFDNYEEHVSALKSMVKTDVLDKDGKIIPPGKDETMIQDGLINQWIGYAPIFKSFTDDDNGFNLEAGKEANIDVAGYGEMGKIYADYMWNMYEQNMAISGLGKAMYEQKLWDDSGSSFKAPTLRGVMDIACDILGQVPGLNFMGFVDDLIFSGLDLTMGFQDPQTIAKQWIKKGLSAAVGAGAGALGNLAGKLEGVTKLLADTGIAMTSNLANQLGGAFIDNIDFTKLGSEQWFNSENFMKQTFNSMDFYSSLASTTIATGMKGTLGLMNLRDGNKIGLAGNVFNTEGIATLNGVVANAMAAGTEYLISGHTSLNLLNISDFGLKDFSKGLFELNIGKNGITTAIGSGGLAMNAGMVYNAIGGLHDAMKVMDWRYGGIEKSSTLNSINMMGYTGLYGDELGDTNVSLAKDIWNGKLKVKYSDELDNEYGNYKGETDYITLSSELLGGGIEASAKLASVMGHEGTHYYGNRVEGVAHTQGLYTYYSLSQMFGFKSDQNFMTSIADTIANPESWKENSGDVDHWLKTIDGRIVAGDGDGEIHEGDRDKNRNLRKNSFEYYEEFYEEDPRTGEIKIGIRVVNNESVGSSAVSLMNYLTEERAEEIGKGDKLDAKAKVKILTHKDYGFSEEDANKMAKDEFAFRDIASGLSAEKQKQLEAEFFLASHGYSYSEEQGWIGGKPLSLSDCDFAPGSISTYKIDKEHYEYTAYKGYEIRDPRSYHSDLGLGKRANDSNNKGLDIIVINQYDMHGNVMDTLYTNTAQTVDVFNEYDEKTNVDRHQPTGMYFINSKMKKVEMEGNTIVSDFEYITSFDYGRERLARKTNCWTINGKYVDQSGLNLEVGGGAWNLEGSVYQTSDGCDILGMAVFKSFYNKMVFNWHMQNGIKIPMKYRELEKNNKFYTGPLF